MRSITGAILILAAVNAAGAPSSDADMLAIPLGIGGLGYLIADWVQWFKKPLYPHADEAKQG